MNIINIQLYNNSTNKMSYIFKTNSRFAALADDIPAKKDKKENKKPINETKNEEKFNSFKSDNNSFKNDGFRDRRYYSERDREAEEKSRKEEEEIRKQKTLTPDNFPDLVSNKKETIAILQEQNYLEKLKKVHDVKDENKCIDPDLKILKPGWLLIKKDKLTNKTIMKGNVPDIKSPEILEEEQDEDETAINVINSLVELHERRTQEYIEFNGYDTWEQMFKFPGWREREAELEDASDYEDETENSEEEECM